MNEPQIIPPGARHRTLRSWPEAYAKFLGSSAENRILKLMPLALVGIVPLSILDDLLLPIAGIVDDVPTVFLVIGTLALTAYRVHRHRYLP